MFIGHYTALPPVRFDPHWPHSHAITASIRLALTHALQHTLLATQTSVVVTTTCLGYLHSHTRTMRPSTASPIYLYACSQRILGVVPSPLALAEALQHPLIATQTPAVATTTCPGYLHPHTRTIRPSTASPIYLYACSQRILGVVPSPLALAEALQQHKLLATQTSAVATTTCLRPPALAYPNDAPIHPRPHRYTSTPALNGYWVWYPSSLLAPRPHTATHTAHDSNLGSGNQVMSRQSAPAYPNDAPIH
jgi:hypothetical protein